MSGDGREPLDAAFARVEASAGHGPARELMADFVGVDLAAPGTLYSWTRQVELDTDPERAGTLLPEIAAAFTADGWQATDRSAGDERALQLSRDGFHLGLTLAGDGARMVVSGSAPPVAAEDRTAH